MTVGEIEILPFNSLLGFDQQQAVIIKGVAYRLVYRYNNYAGFVTLSIVRAKDGMKVWSGKLTKYWGGIAKDPDNHSDLFAFGVRWLSATGMEIQVYYDPV